MKLRDFLSNEESKEFDELQLALLNASSHRELRNIQLKIDVLIEKAKVRYEEYLAKNEQSASAYENIIEHV